MYIVQVDDNPDALQVFAYQLRKYMPELGQRLRQFTSVKSAIDFVKIHAVVFVVTDYLMPEMNGVDFLQICKTYRPNINTALVSGVGEIFHGSDVADTILQKPISQEELQKLFSRINESFI